MKEHGKDNANMIRFGVSDDGTGGTPRDIDSGTHKPKIEEGTGGITYLADEKYFKKYWHLLFSDKCDPCNIMEQVYNHTQDTSIGIHGSKLKAEAGTLSGLAGTLSGNASSLHSALGSSTDQATRKAQEKVTALKDAASKASSNENEKGLQQLLGELSSAGFFELVSGAKLVLQKYNEVAIKYGKVAEDETAKGQEQFKQVTSAFNELQTEFNMIKRLDKFNLVTVPSIITNWLNF